MIRRTILSVIFPFVFVFVLQAQYSNQQFELTYPSGISEENKTFVETMIPEIIQANNEVLWVREKIERISGRFESDNHVTTSSLQYLQKISRNYKTSFEFSIYTTPEQFRRQIRQLLIRVDKVPEELVLAQAVLESEWGRSRFAAEGNNFFGIRCFKPGCGIVPEGAENQSFMVRSYDTPLDGIRDYLYNLNVGSTYRDFRAERARQRQEDRFPETLKLAETLHGYSEIGSEYFTRLSWLIRRKLPAIELTAFETPYDVNVSSTNSMSSLTDL